MPTNVSYCSDESYSSSVKSASHGNVLKQLLLAGKSNEIATKSIYSVDSSLESSPPASPLNYSVNVQKPLYNYESPLNLSKSNSCSSRQHKPWSPPILSPPSGPSAVPRTTVAHIENYPEPPYFLYNPYFLWQLSSYRQLCHNRAVQNRTC